MKTLKIEGEDDFIEDNWSWVIKEDGYTKIQVGITNESLEVAG